MVLKYINFRQCLLQHGIYQIIQADLITYPFLFAGNRKLYKYRRKECKTIKEGFPYIQRRNLKNMSIPQLNRQFQHRLSVSAKRTIEKIAKAVKKDLSQNFFGLHYLLRTHKTLKRQTRPSPKIDKKTWLKLQSQDCFPSVVGSLYCQIVLLELGQ